MSARDVIDEWMETPYPTSDELIAALAAAGYHVVTEGQGVVGERIVELGPAILDAVEISDEPEPVDGDSRWLRASSDGRSYESFDGGATWELLRSTEEEAAPDYYPTSAVVRHAGEGDVRLEVSLERREGRRVWMGRLSPQADRPPVEFDGITDPPPHDPTGADHMEDAARLAEENDALRAEAERSRWLMGGQG